MLSGAGRHIAYLEWSHCSDRSQANIDDLHRLGTVVMTIGLQMASVEEFRDVLEGLWFDRIARNGHCKLIRLARITGINRALEALAFRRDAGPVEHRGSLALQDLEDGPQCGGISIVG